MVMRQTPDPQWSGERPNVTMTRHELVAQIRRHGIWTISQMFNDQAARITMGLRDGVNVEGWEMTHEPGVIRFALRRDRRPGPPEEMVIYLNTDNPGIIANWSAELPAQVPCPYELVTRSEGKIDQERDPPFLAIRDAFARQQGGAS